MATREVVYYGNFRKDVERSEARKRKIRKELAKLEQGRQETYNDFLRNFHVFKSYDLKLQSVVPGDEIEQLI